METCSIGIQLPRTEYVHLSSTRTLLDFDTVIIDPSGIHNIGREHYARRKDDVVELLARGGTVVLFVRPSPLDLLLPIDGATGDAYSGTKVDVVGSTPFQEFWTAVGGLMSYAAVVRGNSGTPTLVVSNTNKVVGSWLSTNSGIIILLPAPKHQPSAQAREQNCVAILTALKLLIGDLQHEDSELALPAWSGRYMSATETELRKQQQESKRIAADTAKNIEGLTAQLQREEKLKKLFTSKGEVLVQAVIEAFQDLGATAQRGVPGRDDIILNFEDQAAVVEVKGKKGSAAEKDAAQLEKWVAGFKETHDSDAKGILVVNAFCDTPLNERIQAAFPDQMLSYCTKREHCLITSTQLLGILLSFRGNKERATDYLKKILSTVGVFDEFSEYKDFLVEQTVTEDPV